MSQSNIPSDNRKSLKNEIKPRRYTDSAKISSDNYVSHSPKASSEKLGGNSNVKKHKKETSMSIVSRKSRRGITSIYDLPERWRKKLARLNIEPKDKTSLFILTRAIQFTHKEMYYVAGYEIKPKERRPYASPEMYKRAKDLVKHLTKEDIKKMIKNTEYSNKGGYGSIYSSKLVKSKRKIAIKKLSNDTEKNKQKNLSEVAFLSVCEHPNIVEFIDAWVVDESKELWIINEFIDGGTLSEIVKCHKFKESHIAYVAREILKALHYLHSKGYVHRDIKSSNIMLSTDGNIKLIDFGLCCEVLSGKRMNMVGSPYWIPPEMIRQKEYSYSVDIWSFAVVILEMFLSEPPNSQSRILALYNTGKSGIKSFIPKSASSLAKDFLSSCLEMDEEKRATAEMLLKHEFVLQPKIDKGIKKLFRYAFITNNLALSGIK